MASGRLSVERLTTNSWPFLFSGLLPVNGYCPRDLCRIGFLQRLADLEPAGLFKRVGDAQQARLVEVFGEDLHAHGEARFAGSYRTER